MRELAEIDAVPLVARMQENMEWMNRVVGSQPVPGEPQLRLEEINAFLRKYARR